MSASDTLSHHEIKKHLEKLPQHEYSHEIADYHQYLHKQHHGPQKPAQGDEASAAAAHRSSHVPIVHMAHNQWRSPQNGTDLIAQYYDSVTDRLHRDILMREMAEHERLRLEEEQEGSQLRGANPSHTDMVSGHQEDDKDLLPEDSAAIVHQLLLPHLLTHCTNHTQCVVPELQLQRRLKVYMCSHPVSYGVRFYYLVREGLMLHPNIDLILGHPSTFHRLEQEGEDIDYVVYLPGSAPWHKTELNTTIEVTEPHPSGTGTRTVKRYKYASKMIVLDEFDYANLFMPPDINDVMAGMHRGEELWYNVYFKRSYVARNDGVFLNYPHLAKPFVYPITYTVAEAYIATAFLSPADAAKDADLLAPPPPTDDDPEGPNNVAARKAARGAAAAEGGDKKKGKKGGGSNHMLFHHQRSIDVLCTLRGNKKMPTRQRVQDAVAEYVTTRKVKHAVTAQVNTASRTTVSNSYFTQMRNARIVVTVNPAHWEGDFRLWEAMATGALVFVDPLTVPHPYPLHHKVHVIYYNNNNMTELFELLDYYRDPRHADEAASIALNGYYYSMKYHRTVSMIDYVFRTAEAHNRRLQRLRREDKEVTLPAKQMQVMHQQVAAVAPSPSQHDEFGYRYTGQQLHNLCTEQLERLQAEGRIIAEQKANSEAGGVEKPSKRRLLPL